MKKIFKLKKKLKLKRIKCCSRKKRFKDPWNSINNFILLKIYIFIKKKMAERKREGKRGWTGGGDLMFGKSDRKKIGSNKRGTTSNIFS